jgi:hypothetical protein
MTIPAEQFDGLLWRDLMVSLLLGVVDRPGRRELGRRTHDAVAAFLQLHAMPGTAPRGATEGRRRSPPR